MAFIKRLKHSVEISFKTGSRGGANAKIAYDAEKNKFILRKGSKVCSEYNYKIKADIYGAHIVARTEELQKKGLIQNSIVTKDIEFDTVTNAFDVANAGSVDYIERGRVGEDKVSLRTCLSNPDKYNKYIAHSVYYDKDWNIVEAGEAQERQEAQEVQEAPGTASTKTSNVKEAKGIKEAQTPKTSNNQHQRSPNAPEKFSDSQGCKEAADFLNHKSTPMIPSINTSKNPSVQTNLKSTASTHTKQPAEWSKHIKLLPSYKEILGINIIDVIEALKSKRSLLIEGASGTGKTQLMFNLLHKTLCTDAKRFKVLSLNPQTTHQKFVGACTSADGKVKFIDGLFTQFCKQADRDRVNSYIICLDNISNCDILSVFGELITALDYRDILVTLDNGHRVAIPSNIYIVATASKRIDTQVYERFSHIVLNPQWTDKYISNLTFSLGSAGKNRNILKEKLHKLVNYMAEINEYISADTDGDIYSLIGTRAISINSIDNKALSQAIKTSLIPSIYDGLIYCSPDTVSRVNALIREIESLA